MDASYVADCLSGKQIGPNQWEAVCPCGDHPDYPLHLSNGKTGKLLLHCKGGCDGESVWRTLVGMKAVIAVRHPSKVAARLKQCREKDLRLQREKEAWLRELWNNSRGAVPYHPYAQRKGIYLDFGARRGTVAGIFDYEADCILIPMYSVTGDWVGIEFISEHGEKQARGRKGWHLQGNYKSPGGVLHIVEGWATGFAIAEDFPSDHGVVICFGTELDKYSQEASSRLGKRTYIHREPKNIDYWDLKHRNPVEATAYVEAVLEEVSNDD